MEGGVYTSQEIAAELQSRLEPDVLILLGDYPLWAITDANLATQLWTVLIGGLGPVIGGAHRTEKRPGRQAADGGRLDGRGIPGGSGPLHRGRLGRLLRKG
ncbi:MAG: hypothetical protein M2R45_04852 [Verrucomicrobia subdivision 3 bacterium]|nr:hypothetical protein [Limisphaerales bacterium]MCS1417541.1 hypothetical protein [Limisphaerales bacterium]